MIDNRKIVAVIGDSNLNETDDNYKLAEKLGKFLADNNFRIQTGGYGGVMEAVFKGSRKSKKYLKDTNIAIIPSNNVNDANEYADIVIPTGLDLMRGAKVVEADAVIAIGGDSETLSEIAMAWQKFKLIISFRNSGGWSQMLSNTKLDERIRYTDIKNDVIYGVDSIQEAIEILNKNINLYNKKHTNVKWIKNKLSIDFHNHCLPHSKDVKQKYKDILLNAKKNEIELVSITNHNTVSDSLLYKKEFEKHSIKYIVGCEISCEIKSKPFILKNNNNKIDILGLDLKLRSEKNIQNMNWDMSKYEAENKKIEKLRIKYLSSKYEIKKEFENEGDLFQYMRMKK